MTLSWQISIIDGLIKENPEATIKDYLVLCEDLKNIEQQANDVAMSRKGIPNLTEEQKAEIIVMARERVPVPLIAAVIGVGENAVYKVCVRDAISIMELKHPEVAGPDQEIEETVSPLAAHPSAEYSNTGYLSLTEKYAL
jgi:hypothetical protein